MKEPTIYLLDIGGQKLRAAYFAQPGANRTLLVFNGIGASLETIDPFAAAFKKTNIVTFDVPGVGGSPAPLLPYRFAGLARMAARVLDELNIGKVDVFGVSWGGALAQTFAHKFPERTVTLTLAATSAGFVMVPGDIRVLMKMATPRRYTDPNFMLSHGPDIYGGQLRVNKGLLREHTAALKSGSNRGYFYQLLAGVGWTSWLWLARLDVPALILMGSDDPVVPLVNGRMLASKLPNATLEVMDCGHLFILTDPQGTAEHIEDFMSRTPIDGTK